MKVSAKHFSVAQASGGGAGFGVVVKDENSANGLMVNGKKLKKKLSPDLTATLKHGDVLGVGGAIELTVRDVRRPEYASASAYSIEPHVVKKVLNACESSLAISPKTLGETGIGREMSYWATADVFKGKG